MKKKSFNEEIAIPEGVTVSIDGGSVNVKGEKGEFSRDLFHPSIKIEGKGDKVVLSSLRGSQGDKKFIFTYKSHIKNMFKGVKEGFVYKLKVCSSHFPMTVSFNDPVIEVKNFIGEKTPRLLTLPKEVKAEVNGEEIIIQGVNKELVGQAAASIERLTKRRGFDKRIFQDGIYIIEKDGKVMK